MRFEFDPEKNREVERKHGVSLEEVQEIFDQVYLVDQKSDDPEQFRAIGWSRGRLFSVIFEIRRDADGEYHRLNGLESHQTGRAKLCRKRLGKNPPPTRSRTWRHAEKMFPSTSRTSSRSSARSV